MAPATLILPTLSAEYHEPLNLHRPNALALQSVLVVARWAGFLGLCSRESAVYPGRAPRPLQYESPHQERQRHLCEDGLRIPLA